MSLEPENTTTSSPATPPAAGYTKPASGVESAQTPQLRRVRVWDAPTRLFHWSLAVLVCLAIVTVKSGGDAMEWHGYIGRLILSLLAFRLVWGVIGSSYARFRDFMYGPRAISDYLRGRWRGVGHNPLGAWSVFALLIVLLLMAGSGLVANDDAAFRGPLYRLVENTTSSAVTIWHKRGEWIVYGLIGLHLLAVLYYSLFRKSRLVKTMITGHQWVNDANIQAARGGGMTMLVIALLIAAGVWWFSAGTWVPEPPPPPPPAFDW